MSNDIKINVKANADLGGVSSGFDDATKKAEQLSNAMDVVLAKAGKSTSINIDTSKAASDVTKLGQQVDDVQKQTTGESTKTGSGKSKREQSLERENQWVDKTRETYKRFFRDVDESGARAFHRAFEHTKDGGSAIAAHLQKYGNAAEFIGDKNRNPAAWKRVNETAGLASVESAEEKKGGALAQYGKGLVGAGVGIGAGMMANNAGGSAVASAGGLVGGGIGAMLGSVIPGVGTAIGGFIGQTLGSAAGGVVGGGMEGAQNESIATSDLRSSVGGLSVSFSALSGQIKTAGLNLGIVSTETVHLAKNFAHISGMASKDVGQLGSEVHNSIGFARGFGLDPSQATSFFATMRMSGASKNNEDNRRLGSVIAESIVKGGSMAKADEVIAAIGNFATTTARNSFNAPNVEGFASALTALTSKRMPGLDVQGAANVLNTMDASFKGGESEAGKTFKLATYSNLYGPKFNMLDADLVTQQGMFGNARGAFNQAREFAVKNNDIEGVKKYDELLRGKHLDDPVGLEVLKAVKAWATGKDGKTDSAMYRKAGVALFGGNEQSFMLGSSAIDGDKHSLGKIKEIQNLDARNQPMALQIMAETDPKKLKDLARQFIAGTAIKGNLADSDKSVLNSQIDSGRADEIKRSLIEILKKTDVSDQGSELRETVANVAQSINDLSSKLLPAVNAVKDAVLFASGKDLKAFEAKERSRIELDVAQMLEPEDKTLAEAESRAKAHRKTFGAWAKSGAKTPEQMLAAKAAWDDKQKELDGEIEAAKVSRREREQMLLKERGYDQVRGGAGNGGNLQAMLGSNLVGQIKAAQQVRLTPEQEKVINDVSGTDAEKARWLAAVVKTENRGFGAVNNNAVSGAGAKGAFQILDSTAQDRIADGALGSEKYDPSNFSHSAKIAAAQYDWLKKNKVKDGDPTKLAAWYNGGYPGGNKSAENRKENDDYVGIVSELYGGETPKSVGEKTRQSSRTEVVHTLQLQYPDGRVGGRITLGTTPASLAAPIPSGARS